MIAVLSLILRHIKAIWAAKLLPSTTVVCMQKYGIFVRKLCGLSFELFLEGSPWTRVTKPNSVADRVV